MLQPGTMIGTRYQVVRLLGQGGMSNIYVCQDTRLRGKMWVVKEMTARYSNPEEQAAALKYFEQEAHLLAHLHHPNLPTVNDYFQFQGKYYLVMEYIEGEDLGRMLARVGGPLPERQVAEWGAQIATVLYYLHCQKPDPIIFRDVKPSNLMVSGAKVKLIDFGIARHFNPNKKGDTMRIGSPGYAPPEQYSGQTDPRSDIYALGVTLHQALTGRDPTTTQTPFQLPPVRNLNPKVSDEMARIIERSTKMLPEERYQNMLEMKRDLQNLVATHRGGTSVVHAPADPAPIPPGPRHSTPPPAPAAPTTPPPKKSAKARRGGFSLSRAAALLMILVGLGFGVRVLADPSNQARLQGLLSWLQSSSGPDVAGGARLYLEGAPLQDVLWALTRERRENPGSGEAIVYWNNALAGLETERQVALGVVVPEGPAGDALVRGVALAQRVVNGLGGIRERLLVVVLERPRPERLGEAGASLAEGRSGRQTTDGRTTRGQAIDALLILGEGEALAKAAERSYPVPTVVVDSSGATPSSSGGTRVLPGPGPMAAAPALAALAGKRPLAVFDASLEAALRSQGAAAKRASLGDAAKATALVRENQGSLFVLAAEGLDRSVLEALLRAGGEVVLLAPSPEALPEVAADLRPRLQALVALSPFHPWPAGAAASRLFPVAFGAEDKAPVLDLETARTYDAVRWVTASVLADAREYRGATLAAGEDGKVRPAPHQLYQAGPDGWVFRRPLEAALR